MTQITPRQAKDMDKFFDEEEEFYVDVIDGADNVKKFLESLNEEDDSEDDEG